MAKNTFSKLGGSTYKCDTCGRNTRYTGAQAIGSTLCAQCWDLAGIENEISDGIRTQADAQARIDSLMADIRAKGGNPDEQFASLLAKPAAVEPEPVYQVEMVQLEPTAEVVAVAQSGRDPNMTVDANGHVHGMLNGLTQAMVFVLFEAFAGSPSIPVRFHLRRL